MRSALVLLAVRADYNTLVRVRYVAKCGTPVLPRVHKSPLRPHDTHAHTHPTLTTWKHVRPSRTIH